MSESSSTASSSGGPSGSGSDQSRGNTSEPGGEQSQGGTSPGSESRGSTWYEEFKVSSDNLVAKVRELIREGNVRRVYIKNESGETLLEIPLTAGVAVTVITAAVAPILVAVGAVAALLTQATIGVERSNEPEEPAAGDAADGSGRAEIGPPADD